MIGGPTPIMTFLLLSTGKIFPAPEFDRNLDLTTKELIKGYLEKAEKKLRVAQKLLKQTSQPR